MTAVYTHTIPVDFKRLYFSLRQKEGRIYSDEEVTKLPEISETQPHHDEWQARKHSYRQLLKYLINKDRPMKILEVGCGNGWLSAKLSTIPSVTVTGIDINIEELEQAKRVFRNIQNLEFLFCNLQDEILKNREFDIIVFAASIQYFSSLQDTLKDVLDHLKPEGEIHIIDSPFYKQNEVAAARQRSQIYYESIGFPEMTDHYFHHCLDDLKSFKNKILYNPGSITRNLWKNKNPFYWICIQQQ